MPPCRSPFRMATVLALTVAAASVRAQTPAAGRVPGSPADSTRRVSVSGFVYDSTSAGPLAEAIVQLSDRADPTRAFSVASDSLGRFRIDSIPPGRYLAGFMHPTLDVLWMDPPLYLVEVGADGVTQFELSVPGPARVRAAVCGAAVGADSGGVLVGFVVDAENRAAVPGARVVVTWHELQFGRRVQLTPRHLAIQAASDGRFAACGVPTDADLMATAEAPGRRSGIVELRPTAFGVYRRDFSLGAAPAGEPTRPSAVPPAARGAATLTGVVRRDDGRPAARVRVVVIGAEGEAETREDGTFTVTGLPTGTYTAEARSVGYAPARAVVDLTSARPATVALAFDQRAQALERIVVKGRARVRVARHDEFLARRQNGGAGRFVTAADIDRRNAAQLTDALRTVPGLQVVPRPRSGYMIRGRAGCVPTLFLDGVAVQDGANDIDLLIVPQTVYGIEVYLGLGGLPVQFANTANNCGAVVVWTK